MPVFASDIAAMHIGAGGHATDPNGLISGVLTPCRFFCADVRCSRHAGSVAAHCSKLQCSRRPDRHVGHPLLLFHAAKVVTNTEGACVPPASRQDVCAGMFLRAISQRCILAQAALPPIRMG